MRNRTAIITRFHYPKNSRDFVWRFDYYKKEVLPRLLAQTDQDFLIYIWCEKHHEQQFLKLSDKIRVFSATYEPRDSHLFIDFTPYENTKDLPKFEIQCGLDSDELVEPDYIKTIHKHCKGNKKRCIMFKGLLYDIKTKEKFYMSQRYSKENGTAMFAFYQPNVEDDYFFILQTSHRRSPKFAEEVIIVPEGQVLVSVHGFNDSTRITSRNKHYEG